MMVLVIGGSGSGKSAYGEERLCGFEGNRRIYLATMIPWDEECRKKIQRHRAMRARKGFTTIEKYRDIQELVIPSGSNVLLECLSNLTANEIFGGMEQEEDQSGETEWKNGTGRKKGEPAGSKLKAAAEKITEGVRQLQEQSNHLVVITNQVFSDGVAYEEETRQYMQALGEINCRLAAMADEVVEVIWGIPVKVKQGLKQRQTQGKENEM